ncbi:MarR family transcriptional regulator [Micromonospora sp. BRA006-A]|nr:MarR family transcriptional regulator [Micromonospora sp. BRA006-A]
MLTSGGMTGRLDRLERAGLVRRSPDPADRRALRVTLTDTGRRVVEESAEAGLAVQRRILDALPPPTRTGWPICCARCSRRPRPGPRIRHNDRHRHRPEGRPCPPPNRRSSPPAWVSPAVAVAPGTRGPAPCST